MLSEAMQAELIYFCTAVLYGMLAAVCYHLLEFLRTLFRHSMAVMDAEDILFLMAAGFAFFLVAYEKNDGILRWYAFAGTALGIWLYLRSIGKVLEKVRKWLLQKLGKPITIKDGGRYKKQLQKYESKGQVSVDEGSSPKHKEKREKKKRIKDNRSSRSGAVRSHHIQRSTAEGGAQGSDEAGERAEGQAFR